ncbi:aminotransferase class I/II-fold pyridoxal phosphate-dependent enzyme [Fructobacillus papyrifericola]|uniref:Aminotransferase n=1 Tax=Fructobacillus papyrifericola TaxID=2713172 RepID=A0ABS5QUM7_9LACO|nr:aminotransferase class I/II-fold pyridoxal phosphate-dependent enzyme [Fructobacillus papyrifericola]MBS9336106.1 aminotransferase class I/II-fold pyridoxal phosphate-dependent enzyme [Fructobacillus papyrifericola]
MNQSLPKLNPAITAIPADKILSFQASIQGVDDLVFLTFGEPGFDTPKEVKEATVKGIQENHSHYGNSQGNPELRQAVLDYMEDRYDLRGFAIDQVVMTAGVTEAIYAVFKVLLSAGDGILVPDPAFGSYFSSIALAGGQAISVDTSKSGFKLTPAMVKEAIESADVPVKAVLFNYPSNPTGVTYDEAELKALAEAFKEAGVWVISDEIYSELTYGRVHRSIASYLPDQAIVVNGLSKSHAMTGYRVGFVLAPTAVAKQIQKVHGNLVYSIPTFVYDGALAALRMPKAALQPMIDTYQERRDMAVAVLKELGFDLLSPDGAFYIFAKLPKDIEEDGWTFAEKLAKEGKVGVIPGEAFSQFDGAKDYVRLSYAGETAQLEEGLKRLKAYIEKRRANR